MTNLDQIDLIKGLDQSDMAGSILALPTQIEAALLQIEKISLPPDWGKVKNICFVGMGGSAIAGALMTDLPALDKKIPLNVIRGYELPNWIDKNSLVIVASHSGKTAEAISVFKYAAVREAKIFVIAERGKLEKMGKMEEAIIFDYDTNAEPRAAIGFQLGAVFGLMKKMEFIAYEIDSALEILRKLNKELNPKVLTEKNLAKSLAYFCFDHLPVIVSSDILKSVAWRWKTQFNENAKNFSFTEVMPECLHNAIEGLDEPKRFRDDFVYLILSNSFDVQELQEKTEAFKNILENKNIAYELIEAAGEDVMSQKFSLVLLGDWVSYYLALLNGIDPTPVKTIEKMKNSNP